MAQLHITLSELKTRQFLADIVPQVLMSRKGGHELALALDEKRGSVSSSNTSHHVIDGNKTVTRKGQNIVLKGKHSEIVLEAHDLKKIQKLL